jgi:hypothetical protein
VRNSSLLINLAKAIGRLVVSYKEIQSLAGYTTLIYEMKEVLDDLDRGHYKRGMVTSNQTRQKIDEDEKFDDVSSPDPLRHHKKLGVETSVLYLDASM